MTESINVDVVVLGGGPGGYTAAFRAADLGLSVCIVEKRDTLGGVCVNVGCIPSKTLLHAASLVEHAKHGAQMGIAFSEPNIDIDALRSHKEKTISELTAGIANLSKARKVLRIQGEGHFTGEHSLLVKGEGEQQVLFKHAIIATGSHSVKLPIAPEDPRVWDSTDALSLPFIPQKLLIIGGGIIGLEMAQVYSALGSEITIVEAQDQIIPAADKDVVQPLLKATKKTYQMLTKTKVTGMTAQPEGIIVGFEGKKAPESAAFDAVLVAVGRRPNTSGIGLENIGVDISEQGLVEVNDRMQTSAPHIFAIGDIVKGPMLAHKATHEGKVASEVISGLDATFHPVAIPSVAYTSPEVAWVGLTEKEAKLQGVEYTTGKVPWLVSGRAQSVGATNGVTKALFDKESGALLGAGICGENAGELIHEAAAVLQFGGTAKDIAHTVHAHPTLAETFAFAAEVVEGSMTDMLPSRRR
ncbi:dihydrolipoyl dehydrogenase [Photobacterium rosenbergii]|uniref:dihydrolipoyl dehydrogenase n=1 Tax=Photobacterium rosenbergii TaxID=294936 RepID=UPI001C996154|nr:dihydrolipoyl dehydrogenase [Photobacterium rosenbergii]MBY5947749.1 dihydrolipoyl dehydrogenase [Photobacterium rosenbergii]